MAVFLVSLDSTVLYAGFSSIHAAFPGTEATDLSWVLNAYTIMFAALLVPAGRAADLYGRKRLFAAGLAIFLLASLACGLASSVPVLVAARAVQGLGAALLMPASLSIVLAVFPPAQRRLAVGLWGATGGLAAALGPIVGSFLVAALGWPWAFYLNLPLGVWALWRTWTILPAHGGNPGRQRLDPVGILLLIAGTSALTWGLIQTDPVGWGSPAVLGAFALGALCLSAFVRWSVRHPHAVVDLTLFRHPVFRFANLATFTFNVAFSMMFFGFFLFLTQAWHYTLPQAGLAITPGPLVVILVAVVAGRHVSHIPPWKLLVLGCLVFAAGVLWLDLHVASRPNYLQIWLPAMLLTGIGVGFLQPGLTAAVASSLDAPRFGMGASVNQAVRQLGNVFGVAFTALLLTGGMPDGSAYHQHERVQLFLTFVTLLFCLGVRPDRPGAPKD
ncbi:MFS transporter [Deinococcus hohokamensis]|uniref:MFS transporter n=1 Tax=Deinococcus hohokamensis TaxID=309883 RepID=A0ABV9IDU7_9DEIO